MKPLELTGSHLTIPQLESFQRDGVKVLASSDARARVEACADFRHRLSLSDTAYYGINTGFGRFATRRIDPADAANLQANLLRSHAVGVGPDLPADVVRLMMVLRANSLLHGHSAVSWGLVELLLALVNHNVVPAVPMYGSVGASGDLAPLAHMSLPLIGEGEVYYQNQRRPAADVLGELGLEPWKIEPKEGLALINGTQQMSAFAVHDLLRMRRYLETSMCAAAMSIEAFEATDRFLDPRLHELKNHPGEMSIAEGFRKLLDGSEVVASHRNCERVQDPYSFRCIPQVLGAVTDVMAWVTEWVTREINAVTDNPVVFPGDGDVISGGNFHGQHMAFALDALAMAACEVASIAERRVDKLIDNDSDKLPRCLIKDPGLNSGLMIAQYLAAALVSENKVLAHPSSVDTIPTSLGFEDHVSMGSVGAFKLTRILDNVRRVVAVELFCGAQALDFHKPLVPGAGTRVVHEAVREHVPFIEQDEVLSTHLKTLECYVESGDVVARVEKAAGNLLPPWSPGKE